MHVEAFGDAQSIARAIRTALASTATSYKDITNEDVDLPGKAQVKSTMPSDAMVQGRERVIDIQLDRRESFTSCESAITSLTSTTAGTTLNTGTSTTDLNAGDLNASALATCRAGTGQIKLTPGAVVFSDITVDWRSGSGTVDADLALLTNEVNPVLRFLESKGFKLSALHDHALTVRPEVFFLHASAEGDVISALQAIRTAWDATGGRTTTTSP